MKYYKKNYCYIVFLIGMLITKNIEAQCVNHVTHTSGSALVNGVNVNVTSSGEVGVITDYCPNATSPYFIGINPLTMNNGDGSYTFNFTPAIESLTLNFSGISNVNGPNEMIVIYVNGTHYSIPNPGIPNICEPLANLTSEGNIVGCNGCSVSGWKRTNIPGPIHTLTVLDSVLIGNPNGSIFSLFICNAISAGISKNKVTKLELFPNPVKDILTIRGVNSKNTQLSLKNIFGQKTFINPQVQSEQILLDVSHLTPGIYFLLIESDGIVETQKISVNF